MTTKFQDFIMQVHRITDYNELVVLNKVVIAQMRNLSKRNTWAYRPGDKVTWTGKRGTLTGTVVRTLTKNVVVNAGAYGQWRIPSAMLKKVA